MFKGLNRNRFWTSGNDLASVSDFFWMANGQPLTYTNWFPGEPNFIGQERCIEISNNGLTESETHPIKWNNLFCDHELNFVCERFL